MATYGQRAVAICDTLVNGVATATQRQRIAAAFAGSLPPEATQAQIAENFIKELRQYVIAKVISHETQASITALQESTAAQVPQEFSEAP